MKEKQDKKKATQMDEVLPDEGVVHPEEQEIPDMEGGVPDYKKMIVELAEYKDKYLRLFAEFENVRKRNEREKMEFVKYANEGIIVEFLGVMDNLERTVDAANAKHQDYEAFLKGIEMVMGQIGQLLKKNDVQSIDAVGKKFDPHCHEILMQEETNEYEESVVIEEFQKGFMIGERVVRTAKVKVAVNSSGKNVPEEEAGSDFSSNEEEQESEAE